jgi:hypothetical protein
MISLPEIRAADTTKTPKDIFRHFLDHIMLAGLEQNWNGLQCNSNCPQ